MPLSSGVKTAIPLVLVGILVMMFGIQVLTGITLIPILQLPNPHGVVVTGTLVATPSVAQEGKIFTLTLHVSRGGVVGYAIVRGPEGDVRIEISQKVEKGTQTIKLRYPWRAGTQYTIMLYTADDKKICETSVKTPFLKPSIEASRSEINYGLVPSLTGTRLFIYGFVEYEAVEIEKLGAVLIAGKDISPPNKKYFIVVETGACKLSKVNAFKEVNNIASWIRAYNLRAEVRTAKLAGGVPASPEDIVFIFLDTIPYELKDSLPLMVSEGAVAIVVSPWLCKYWFKGQVLWIDPSPHPEYILVKKTFNVFEETSVSSLFTYLFYNHTIRTRKVEGNLVGLGEIYIFKVGRGFVIWIPASYDEIPNCGWLITQLAVTGFWNIYYALAGGGSYAVETSDLNYDYTKTSLFTTVPIQPGVVNVYLILLGSNGGYKIWVKTLYIPQVIRK